MVKNGKSWLIIMASHGSFMVKQCLIMLDYRLIIVCRMVDYNELIIMMVDYND